MKDFVLLKISSSFLSCTLIQQPNAVPSLQSHYSPFITTTNCSVLVPSIGTLTLVDFATWFSPLAPWRLVPVVPYKSLNQTHATCTPDTIYPVIRFPVGLSESNFQTLILISISPYDASAVVRSHSSSWSLPLLNAHDHHF